MPFRTTINWASPLRKSSRLSSSSSRLSYNHCCDALTSIIISDLTISTQYQTKQVSIGSYCGAVHSAVIWLGIIRPAFEFPMCVPGQPASLASKHWLIHCVSAQTGRSISPPLDQAENGILKNILLFSWAHLWYVSLRELLSLREDI